MIYAWGDSPAWNINKGFTRVRGKFDGNTLVLKLQRPATVVYKVRVDGKLDATYEWSGGIAHAVLERDKESKITAFAKPYTPKITNLKSEMSVVNIRDIPDFKSEPRPNDIAIVIGIENYQTLPKSDYSSNDAKLMKEYLVSLGVKERNIELLLNERATQSSIKKTIESWLPNRTKSNSKVVIYYSGYGAPEPKTGLYCPV